MGTRFKFLVELSLAVPAKAHVVAVGEIRARQGAQVDRGRRGHDGAAQQRGRRGLVASEKATVMSTTLMRQSQHEHVTIVLRRCSCMSASVTAATCSGRVRRRPSRRASSLMRAPPASPSRPRCGCPVPRAPVLLGLVAASLPLRVGITGCSRDACAVARLDDRASGAPSRRRPQIAARIDVHSKNARLLALSWGAAYGCVQGFYRAMWR